MEKSALSSLEMNRKAEKVGWAWGAAVALLTPPYSEFTSDPGSFFSVSRVSILGFLLSKVTYYFSHFFAIISFVSSAHLVVLPSWNCQVYSFAEFTILNQSSP